MRENICIITHGIDTVNFRGKLISSLMEHNFVCILMPFNKAREDVAILKAMGVSCHNIHLSQHGLNPFSEIKTFNHIYKKLSEIKPDIILNYTIKPIIWGSLAARRWRETKIFSMVPGRGRVLAESNKLSRRMVQLGFHFLYRAGLKNNTAVFFLNSDDREYFVKNKLLKRKQAVLLNSEGLCLSTFPYCEYQPEQSGKITFFMMARIMRDKGVFEYLEAANRIVNKYSNVCFRLAGSMDDSMSKKDICRFKQLILHDRIVYLGRINEVISELKACEVYVLPSFYQEGLPRSTLEAMAIGRGIITTDWTGCRNTVEDGVNGYLVKVKSSDDLSNKMERFLTMDNRDEMISEMGKVSRMMVEDKHDVRVINSRIIQAIGLAEESID